jgi:hypothetical protein
MIDFPDSFNHRISFVVDAPVLDCIPAFIRLQNRVGGAQIRRKWIADASRQIGPPS